MKNPTRVRWATPALLFWLAGCVSIDLEDLATAECAVAADCQAGATCIDGACVACGAEICDGVDNDCDGNADEDFDLQTDPIHCGACNATCAGICGDGVCTTPDCVPADETCNGADDDCDGNTDEGTLNACGACGDVPVETCEGTDEDCDGNTDEGLLNACGRCGEVPEEVCNGADDDCDGLTDEAVLNACGRCGAAPVERCNDLDDDCDGNADEDFAQKGEVCTVGEGQCAAAATYECAADGTALTCPVEAGAPADELCGTELDEDCDGAVDEGFDAGEGCTVGDGACGRQGVRVCSADRLSAPCDAVAALGSDETCNDLDDDCDGLTDETFDLQSDLANCGGCGSVCATANATPICVMGSCAIDGCEMGFEDTDADPSNGCECQPGVYDAPDALGLDTNCDGIDGTVARSIFVSATHGLAAGTGTADDPVGSLAQAVALVTPNRNDILLTAEDHRVTGNVVLTGDLGVFGGYAFDAAAPAGQRWTRDLSDAAPRSRVVRVDGASPVLAVAAGASVRLTALGVDFDAPAYTGNSRVGIFTRGCRSLTLEDTTVRVPPGTPGAPGRIGADGADSAVSGDRAVGENAGRAGQNPECRDADGGDGGQAYQVPFTGDDGQDSPGGARGGVGAASHVMDEAAPGADGEAGSAGAAPVILPDGWSLSAANFALIAPTSSAAGPGEPGVGGGGGGASYNFGGGGGAAGGCPGGAGGNGTAGGSSVAIVIEGSCDLSITGGRLTVGDGGVGGAAGPGGRGARGAAGGAGAGPVNRGGNGGDGGCGGHGLPGAGGNALAVLRVGPIAQGSVAIETELLLGIVGGPGAAVPDLVPCGPGPDHQGGIRAEIACCANPSACGYDLLCPAAP